VHRLSVVLAAMFVVTPAVVATGAAEPQTTSARNGQIAFARGNWIYVVGPNGGTPTRLVKGSNPDWSPDGAQLAFDRNYNLYVSDSHGRNVRKLTDDGRGPAWSPDGKRIAFTGIQYPFSDCTPTSTYEIVWTIAADGSDRKLFTPKGLAQEICSIPGGDTDPSWSPGGKSIVFTYRQYVVHDIFDQSLVVAPVAGKPRRVIRAGAQPDWSPDGKSIAWSRYYRGVSQIFSGGPTAASKARRLTRGGKGSYRPVWSPDGAKIVFVRSGALMVLDLKTRKVLKITSGPSDGAPSWRPAT
jgi:TolB protein